MYKLTLLLIILTIVGCTNYISEDEAKVFECKPSEFVNNINTVLKDFESRGIVLTGARFTEYKDPSKIRFVIKGTHTNNLNKIGTML